MRFKPWRLVLSAIALASLALTLAGDSKASASPAATAATTATRLTPPHYFPAVVGDTYFDLTGTAGNIIATMNDGRGVSGSCPTNGRDVVILRATRPDPAYLSMATVNCMTALGP